MAGTSAIDAEVARRRHDALTEMILPEAIDDHASRQCVLRRSDPIRQYQPPFLLRRIEIEPPAAAKFRESARRYFLARLHRIAAMQAVSFLRRNEHAGIGLLFARGQLRYLFFNLAALLTQRF